MSKIVAYLGAWARYRKSPRGCEDRYSFFVEDVDPTLCTHLIYAFAKLDETTGEIRSVDPWQDIEDGIGGYKKATNLKRRNPNLKVLIAVGGGDDGIKIKFSEMAASANLRKLFVKSVVKFIGEYKFDGLDLDWEFPCEEKQGRPEDKDNFLLLIQDLRHAFDCPGRGWLLTAALGASKKTLRAAYDIPAISAHLDFMNIMTYNYHGDWDEKAGVNTPLHAQHDSLSVEDTLTYLISHGAPREKIVMGLAMFGRTFCLDKSGGGLGAPCSRGFKRPGTNQKGMIGYHEINALKNEGWNEYWDEKTSTPYLMNGTKLVSFDNVKSIRMKIEYGKILKIGGFMAWSIDTDDFQGISGVTFPLLKLMKG